LAAGWFQPPQVFRIHLVKRSHPERLLEDQCVGHIVALQLVDAVLWQSNGTGYSVATTNRPDFVQSRLLRDPE
jgi:hypothetical protein